MSLSVIGEYISVFMLLIGSIISVISAYGIIRFPDIYTRSHAATKSSNLGVMITLTGAFLYFFASESFVSIRLILGIFFVFLTSPVAGHLITRAAYRSGVKVAEQTTVDELAGYLEGEGKQNVGKEDV